MKPLTESEAAALTRAASPFHDLVSDGVLETLTLLRRDGLVQTHLHFRRTGPPMVVWTATGAGERALRVHEAFLATRGC